jgi:hypothetical protein
VPLGQSGHPPRFLLPHVPAPLAEGDRPTRHDSFTSSEPCRERSAHHAGRSRRASVSRLPRSKLDDLGEPTAAVFLSITTRAPAHLAAAGGPGHRRVAPSSKAGVVPGQRASDRFVARASRDSPGQGACSGSCGEAASRSPIPSGGGLGKPGFVVTWGRRPRRKSCRRPSPRPCASCAAGRRPCAAGPR